eukprot:1719491-Alexandrium_andersonii.AAC.1
MEKTSGPSKQVTSRLQHDKTAHRGAIVRKRRVPGRRGGRLPTRATQVRRAPGHRAWSHHRGEATATTTPGESPALASTPSARRTSAPPH